MASFSNREKSFSPVNLQENEKLIQDLKVILADLTTETSKATSANKINLINCDGNKRI
ncbi:MAG: hypothetical protein ACD_20C00297G0010 [uncultured bacterium]|nr:MAG: hypothetical protein ACD_20C00297G0010 [uncultured bacterium]